MALTEKEIEQALEMRRHGCTHQQIARSLRRRVQDVYLALLPFGGQRRARRSRPVSAEVIDKARGMLASRYSWERIAKELGVSEYMLRAAMTYIPTAADPASRVEVPRDVWADRERRLSRQTWLTPGQLLLGDPLPGRSALDQRRRA